jgi:hypothetical protein
MTVTFRYMSCKWGHHMDGELFSRQVHVFFNRVNNAWVKRKRPPHHKSQQFLCDIFHNVYCSHRTLGLNKVRHVLRVKTWFFCSYCTRFISKLQIFHQKAILPQSTMRSNRSLIGLGSHREGYWGYTIYKAKPLYKVWTFSHRQISDVAPTPF